MLSNEEVVRRWSIGKKGSNKNMSTNGRTLFSYWLNIGYTTGKRKKVVIDHSGRYSVTTTRHVNLAKRYAHIIIEPGRYL